MKRKIRKRFLRRVDLSQMPVSSCDTMGRRISEPSNREVKENNNYSVTITQSEESGVKYEIDIPSLPDLIVIKIDIRIPCYKIDSKQEKLLFDKISGMVAVENTWLKDDSDGSGIFIGRKGSDIDYPKRLVPNKREFSLQQSVNLKDFSSNSNYCNGWKGPDVGNKEIGTCERIMPIGGKQNMKREILVIGSREGKPYAKVFVDALNEEFKGIGMDCDCGAWYNAWHWRSGVVTLDALVQAGQRLKKTGGYVVAVFTPDDQATVRGKSVYCSRDNVWLEYGLFVGIIGAEHVFIVCPDEEVTVDGKQYGWRLPTDVHGQRYVYDYQGTDVTENCLKNVASLIMKEIFRAEKTEESGMRSLRANPAISDPDQPLFRTTY